MEWTVREDLETPAIYQRNTVFYLSIIGSSNSIHYVSRLFCLKRRLIYAFQVPEPYTPSVTSPSCMQLFCFSVFRAAAS